MTKPLLIFERPFIKRPQGFKHVFSFCANEADSFPEDYLNDQEVRNFYDLTYNEIFQHFDQSQAKKLVTYQGVDLVNCFKKLLFDYAYISRLRYETIKRLLAKVGAREFYIPSTERRTSSIISFIKGTPLKDSMRFCQANPGLVQEKIGNRNNKNIPFYWPHLVTFGRRDSARTLVFSNLEKTEGLMNGLKSEGAIFICNAPSVRIPFRCWRNKIPLYQFVFNGLSTLRYRSHVEHWVDKLRESRPFLGLKIGEIDGETLLGPKIEEYFRLQLPKLLFEIDCIHQFFKSNPNVQSALLDEDVLPTKNMFSQIARQYRVQTMVECHGCLGHKAGFLPLTADWILVWGKAQKTKLISWGCEEERIKVTGCSRYERYQSLDERLLRHQVTERYQLDATKKIILWAPCPVPLGRFLFENKMRRVNQEMMEVLLELAEAEGLQFIIKLHPRELEGGRYQQWVKSHQLFSRGVVLQKEDPLILIKATDLLVSYFSTLAIDGFAMNRPVISLCPQSNQILDEFRGFDVFYEANGKIELFGLIRSWLEGKLNFSHKINQARQECLNEGLGISTERVKECLLAS